ncbi:MAG: sigma 54-interacting transcriptional regulator [Acidobacteria bacterium]|nr:sigma 54-interacting transcriptional regulator [Acidobacteriota bacterium]
MFRILFACSGNAGRSQMAVAFARRISPKDMEITCAGDVHQDVAPSASRVMAELGIEIAPRVALALDEIRYEPFDVVVTLCNHSRESCPTLPGSPARVHWPLVDPATQDPATTGPADEVFRQVRDDIRHRVEGLFQFGFLESIRQVRITLGSLLDNLTDGVLAHDMDRRIYFFNRAAQQITEREYGDVIGRDCHDVFLDRFCGGDCSFCTDQRHAARSRLGYPRTFITKRGERRDLQMSVVTTETPEHHVTGALVVFRDVTEVVHLRERLEHTRGFCGIVGRHPLMQRVFDSIRELTDINVPILIQGESGTGKELVATALHQLSRRGAGPFVPVNCGALPEGTLESELFGHVKGAFTGAIHDRKGRFALSEGGTIFLDEIGEISSAMQVKLLRVVQDKLFMPVGGERNLKADVRVICATNKDLKRLTQQGLFREDLYYRLAVVPLTVPPLRERASDIPLLVEHFLDKFSSDTAKRVTHVTPAARARLESYAWPGNVRELGNAVQFGMIKCHGDALDLQHLPPEIVPLQKNPIATKAGRPGKLDVERVADALSRAGGSRAHAARLLAVSRTTLYRFLDGHPVFHNTDL